jgi:hypothetical protein
VENLRVAFELHEAGVEMKRQNLRRRFPDADETEIEAGVRAWLQERPGAEHGDGPGKVIAWPRRGR